MDRAHRQRLQSVIVDIQQWGIDAKDGLRFRRGLDRDTRSATKQLRSAVVAVTNPAGVVWNVLPLNNDNLAALSQCVLFDVVAPLTAEAQAVAEVLTGDALSACERAKPILGFRRIFLGAKARDDAEAAARQLFTYHGRAQEFGVPQTLSQLRARGESFGPPPSPLVAVTKIPGLQPALLIDTNELLDAAAAVGQMQEALQREDKFRSAAVTAANRVRAAETEVIIRQMHVRRLGEATRERLTVAPLETAGIVTVADVRARGRRLEQLPGIGEVMATRMLGAAQTLWQTTLEEMPARIDIKRRTDEATTLLRCLRAWQSARNVSSAHEDLKRLDLVAQVTAVLNRSPQGLMVGPGLRGVQDLRDEIRALKARAATLHGGSSRSQSGDVWDDFLAHPADYYAMLSELGFMVEDEQKNQGDLPEEIVAAVRDHPLYGDHLNASLRGYQSFAARFALVQRKVIIGDEMGLGKTIEAIATMAHLRTAGALHFLVVCPAGVVTNWMREVSSKSKLRPHRVHGPEREAAARAWARHGGVAVTTFETLAWFEDQVVGREVACLVVDEAHYVKNPGALRSQRVARLVARAERAMLMTGTPLENRLDEFRNLVGYVRPDLVMDSDELSPSRFRRDVAPAYLRRNQEDVLTELPELVEVQEWVPMTTQDERTYRSAVLARDFHAMRQAAYQHGKGSGKVQRLLEIVEEAKENDRRVIVFSYYRSVLETVVRALPSHCFGPITGSVPAPRRQQIVDEFSAADHGAVLVSQISAGGVGLNIQAASVVVICEPQLKPTIEWQAIARARRMGQLDSVQVHRLLSEEGVDRRVTEILAGKQALFEEFAKTSATAHSAPEAFDVSEAELVRQVVEEERIRVLRNEVTSPSESAVAPDQT